MRFGLLYRRRLPLPWTEGAEHRLFEGALAQVEFADHLGIDYISQVEHHFLKVGAHSSAPRRSSSRPSPRAPAASASAVASSWRRRARHCRQRRRAPSPPLDLTLSNGIVIWGTRRICLARQASRAEASSAAEKKAMGAERAVEQTPPTVVAIEPCLPASRAEFFSMPVRNIVPKPPAEAASADLGGRHAGAGRSVPAARAGIGALSLRLR